MRALALSLLVSLASASAAPAAEDLTRKKVQTYLDLAADLFKASDFEGALAELRRAEALSDLPVVRFNIARCLDELHQDTEAIGAYQQYLSLKDESAGAAERERRGRDAIVRLSARAFGSLEVSCPVEGSSVMVAGLMQVPEQCPFKSAQVRPGTYDIQTFSPGLPVYSTRVEIAAGKVVNIVAEPKAAGAPTTPRGDDKPAPPPTPTAQTDLPRREDKPVAQPEPAAAPLPAPRPSTEVAQRSSSAKARLIAGIALTAVGVGMLSTTAYFMYDGKARTDRIKNGELDTAADIQSEANAGQTDNIAAIACGSIGLAATAAGVILLISGTSSGSSPQAMQVGPAAFPSGAGVVLSGHLP